MSLFPRARARLSDFAALLAATLVLGLAPASGGAPPTQEPDTEYSRMLLVLDSSGSMAERAAGGGGSKMQAAKQALTQVVGELPAESQVGSRVYGATVLDKRERGACRDSQLVVEPGTENRDRLRQAIGQFKPYGETPIAHALQEAAKDLGDEGRRSVVLVSDGIDLQVDVIGLGVEGSARNQLQCTPCVHPCSASVLSYGHARGGHPRSGRRTDELGGLCREGRDSRNVNRDAILPAQTSTGQDEQFPVESCWQGTPCSRSTRSTSCRVSPRS